jgi:hypothetical protein
MSTDEKNTELLQIRISPTDKARIQLLAEDVPVASESSMAREALRLGLEAIEKDPAILLGRKWTTRGGARKGAGRKKANK